MVSTSIIVEKLRLNVDRCMKTTRTMKHYPKKMTNLYMNFSSSIISTSQNLKISIILLLASIQSIPRLDVSSASERMNQKKTSPLTSA